jgi:hypothetical protein
MHEYKLSNHGDVGLVGLVLLALRTDAAVGASMVVKVSSLDHDHGAVVTLHDTVKHAEHGTNTWARFEIEQSDMPASIEDANGYGVFVLEYNFKEALDPDHEWYLLAEIVGDQPTTEPKADDPA